MDYVKICCCTIAFVLYVNTLNAGFVYDDRRAILNNPDVINASEPWSHLFYNDFWGTNLTDSGSHCSYRPLTVLTFKLNHALGGTDAFGYHLVNVLLHCFATCLVVNLGRHILPCTISTLLSALLFAVHPIHTEAVAGLTGRADLIACIFFILTILSYIKHVQLREKSNVQYYFALLGAIISASAAILCKETAVSALIVCAIYDILKGYRNIFKDKHQLRSISIIGIFFLVMIHLRLSIPRPVTPFSTADNPTAKANSLMTRFYTFLYLPVINFFLMIHPETLSFDWSMDAIPRIETLFDSRNFLTLIFYLLFLRLVYVSLWNINFRTGTIEKEGNTSNKPQHGRSFSRRKGQINNESCKASQSCTKQQFPVLNNNNNENKCLVCNKKIQHMSECCMGTAAATACEYNAYRKLIISFSPLQKYIKNNSSRAINSENNNNNDNNNNLNNNNNNNNEGEEDEVNKDNNNNNITDENNNNNEENNNGAVADLEVSEVQTKIPPHEHVTIAKKSAKMGKCPTKEVPIESISAPAAIQSPEVQTKVNQATATLLSVTILILPFLPASNIFFYVGFVIGERILYLPSVGFCLLIGLGIEKLVNLKKKYQAFIHRETTTKKSFILVYLMRVLIVSLCATVFISMSLKTVQRNLDWKNEESLYKSAIHVNPPKALGNLGSVLSSKGQLEIAEVALITALKFRPNMADVHYNLGVLYSKQLKHKDAVMSFRKAIYYRPKLTLAYLNLGTSLIALGRYHEAAIMLREGSRLDGNGLRDRREHENARISSLLVLGQLLTDQGRLQRAVAVYREALATLPTNYPVSTSKEIYHRLGDIFIRLKKLDSADLESNPKSPSAAQRVN